MAIWSYYIDEDASERGGEMGFIEAETLEIALDLASHEEANVYLRVSDTALPAGFGPVFPAEGRI